MTTKGKRTTNPRKTGRSTRTGKNGARDGRHAWEELAEQAWPPAAENRGPWLPYRRIIE